MVILVESSSSESVCIGVLGRNRLLLASVVFACRYAPREACLTGFKAPSLDALGWKLTLVIRVDLIEGTFLRKGTRLVAGVERFRARVWREAI
jgi:hypothetical protein